MGVPRVRGQPRPWRREETEDGVGLHYIGAELHEAVAMRDGARAWWVEPCLGGGYHDKAIQPRRL